MYSLDTPESVTVAYDVAGVGTRFMAALIDSAVQIVLIACLVIVATAAGANLGSDAGYVIAALGLLIINLVLLGYYVFFEIVWNGQSPGKRALRLRVILASGYPVTPFAVLIRNIVRLIDFLPALYAVGLITMIANHRSRRLGDLIAGTMVIKERREVALSSLSSTLPVSAARLPAFGGPGQGTFDDGGAQVHLLPRDDEAIIRDYLGRAPNLTPERREALAGQIAAVVRSHIGGTMPSLGQRIYSADAYLQWVLTAHEAERSKREDIMP